MFLMILMFNIIATATSVVVAQYLGAGQHERMNMIYTLAFVVNLVAGVVLSAGFVLAKYPIMELIRVPEQMRPDAAIYINIVGGGLFFQACYNVMLQILRCNGHAKVGMYISIAINMINIVGNYVFLYGPLRFLNLGVAGVAIATVTARAVALTASLIFFYRKKIGRLALRYIRPFPGKLLLDMIKIGLPSAGENMSYNMYQLVLLSFINSMGNDAVNAKVYCASLMSFRWYSPIRVPWRHRSSPVIWWEPPRRRLRIGESLRHSGLLCRLRSLFRRQTGCLVPIPCVCLQIMKM